MVLRALLQVATGHIGQDNCHNTRSSTRPRPQRRPPSSTRSKAMSIMADADINIETTAPLPAAEEKPEKIMLAELKNGKLVFKQKPMSFEKLSETMQEIVNFREMLEQRIASKEPPLTSIPDEHKPLIAKFVQESDKGLQALCRHIQHELFPMQDEDDEETRKVVAQALPLNVVEKAVKAVASRQNYGLDSLISGGKVPAAWQVWRWEVKEELRSWLPKSSQEKVQIRFLEREEAKKDVLALFRSLPLNEQHALIGAKTSKSTVASGKDRADLVLLGSVQTVSDAAATVSSTPSPQKYAGTKHQEEDELESDGEPPAKRGRPKKDADLEKVAKEKEREAKKVAKAEKEKKEKDAQGKSRDMFANFFVKPKKAGSSSAAGTSAINKPKPGSSRKSEVSDFEKTFKPFRIKKTAELAPINWFSKTERRLRLKAGKIQDDILQHHIEGDVIVIDDDDEVRPSPQDEDTEMLSPTTPNMHLGQMTADGAYPSALIILYFFLLMMMSSWHLERLRDVVSSLPQTQRPYPRRSCHHQKYKLWYPVRASRVLEKLEKATGSGDSDATQHYNAILSNQKILPMKLAYFHDEDIGYWGTWSQPSLTVGPRTPFALDMINRYWDDQAGEAIKRLEENEEEEEEGEGEEVMDEDGSEDEEEDEDDSDLGEFIVTEASLGKRRRNAFDDKRDPKKQKIVAKLVPFTKGPCWEDVIGCCDYEPFEGYRIQLFSDASLPIDPFRWVSWPLDRPRITQPESQVAAADDLDFVVPPLPPHLAASLGQIPRGSTATAVPPAKPAEPKRKDLPKTVFPSQHIPLLLETISSLKTSSLQFIIDTAYKALSGFDVKKNSIGPKVRELACKEKIWIVKEEVKNMYSVP
ncbi:hypothetical protein NM688_g2931 [Phlebia brevispora]|uniref:Uncharacterized protein n=1 Tax=Phlebia brevispora TaxID=194682 RepID=A0ACC1T6X9_9APHY|nr:hypothetical protein NM688_g2931 [Phlebia brevispora]